MDNQGLKPGRGRDFFSSPHQEGSGAHPDSYKVGGGGSFLRVKCKVGHSPPSSTKNKKRVELYFHSPIHLIAWYSVLTTEDNINYNYI
jgi:hypothetical protein